MNVNMISKPTAYINIPKKKVNSCRLLFFGSEGLEMKKVLTAISGCTEEAKTMMQRSIP